MSGHAQQGALSASGALVSRRVLVFLFLGWLATWGECPPEEQRRWCAKVRAHCASGPLDAIGRAKCCNAGGCPVNRGGE